MSEPRRKLIGFSECWNENSTGLRDFYFLFIRVYRRKFYHSTWWAD